MRSLVLSALLLSVAAPALAQMPPPDVRQDRDYRGDRQDDRGQVRDDRGERHDDRGDYRGERHDDRDGYRGDRDRRDDRGDYHGDRDRREFRDDRRDYRQDERFARFRGPAFAYPRGYGYRYYGVGNRLPRTFYTYRDFIPQPGLYRLPPVYSGTRWVRVGPDAILVRLRDGVVVRSIRGLFY